MTAPRTTRWPLEPHSRAKHGILRYYLGAWIPILSLGKFPHIAYIDGFAGPGRYSTGEDGSPVLAVKAVLAQRVPITAALQFFFVEKESARAADLESALHEIPVAANLRTSVHNATFEEAYLATIKPYLDRTRPPVFAFLDPFGYTGIPFDVVCDILRRHSAEVLITFMYEEINRFALVPHQAEHMDRLFGTDEWRAISRVESASERRAFFERLYARQLGKRARVRAELRDAEQEGCHGLLPVLRDEPSAGPCEDEGGHVARRPERRVRLLRRIRPEPSRAVLR